MARTRNWEKTPLLEANSTQHNSYGITEEEIQRLGARPKGSIIIPNRDKNQQTNAEQGRQEKPSINGRDVAGTSVQIEAETNNWIESVSRHGGETQKRTDNNGNWEYTTEIRDDAGNLKSNINENYEIVNTQKYWTKTSRFINGKIKFELFSFNENDQLSKIYKNYENVEKFKAEMNHTTLNLDSFNPSDYSLKTIEYKFLEEVTIKTINNIDNFIKNTKLFNEKLILLKENSNSNLNVLLELYQYLTIVQNFLDSSKLSDTSTSSFFKRMWNTTSNLTMGLLQIYIGLTGKNLQRVVSNYPIDGKEHSLEEYFDAVFLNWQNYLMVFIDTALGTFLTSAMSTWSRDVIFNKENKTNLFEIKQFNTNEFEKYKDMFEFFLYEENHQELMKYFPKITAVNDLMQKFNAIENSTTFQYHPNFEKEVETIQKLIVLKNNNSSTDIDNIKKVISSANKMIKSIEKKPTKSLALANNWGRNLLVNFTLESLTWGASHVILTGSSENTSKEDFNLQEWITKDIFATGALIGNISRYFVMRPINNIFKAGLERLGIPTNLCPEKLSKWINKQSRTKKLMMAIPLFLAVTFTVNAVKTEAALTTENGIAKATELFYEKFFRLTTLGFSIGVTMIDMIAFAISDFYKDVFNQSINVKTLSNILTKCCGFNKQETSLLEDNLTKLENNGKLPTFDEEFEKLNNENSSDSGIDQNDANSNDFQNQHLLINV